MDWWFKSKGCKKYGDRLIETYLVDTLAHNSTHEFETLIDREVQKTLLVYRWQLAFFGFVTPFIFLKRALRQLGRSSTSAATARSSPGSW